MLTSYNVAKHGLNFDEKYDNSLLKELMKNPKKK